MQMLEPLLKQAGELPSLPEVYIRVTELLETESSTGIKIGEAVQSDPALTARILKLINSAYYGLQNPVTSISQAVTLLGRQQLRQVLVGSVLASVFKDFDITEFPLRDFWQHSIKTAIIGPTIDDFFSTTTGAGSALAAAGAADNFGAGGGHVVSPPVHIVAPRMTSSSMFKTMLPSFSGLSSVSR